MHIWEPSKLKSQPDSSLRYQLVIMLQKDNPSCEDLTAAIKTEKEIGKASLWGGKLPAGLKSCYRDGDDEELFPDKDEYRGHWIISAKGVNRPGIVNKALKPIIDRDEIGSGDYGIVDCAINAYKLDDGVSNGLNVFLNNICVTQRGERFGGKEDAETAFKDFVKPEGFNPLDGEDELSGPNLKKAKRNLLD